MIQRFVSVPEPALPLVSATTMAEGTISALAFLIMLIAPVLGREAPQSIKTTSFDVSACLSSLQALSANSKRMEKSSSASAPDARTLSLHSRYELDKSGMHQDFRAFTLARLRRDAARVEALTARLHIAVSGIKTSDLTPVETEALEGRIVSGMKQGSGEYFCQIRIGTPPKPAYLVVDTGSDVTWIQCKPCSDCYRQTGSIYDPSASSSYSTLPCVSSQCKSLDVSYCRNNSCLYQVSYGDGSYTTGDFVTETVSFGTSAVMLKNVALGCGHDNEGLFVGAAGLLGLGRGDLSFPSQIRTSTFSYCLVDRDSTSSSALEFGGVIPRTAVTAPLLRNNKMESFYYVRLTGISVGGRQLSIESSFFEIDETGSGGMIVDSGTAVTRLQKVAYNALRDAFVAATADLPLADGVALFDTCYDFSSKTTVDVPTVSFIFPDGELQLPASNYLIPVDTAGTVCLAFASTSSPLSIIGNVQQQGTRVTFDLARSLVGFEANKC